MEINLFPNHIFKRSFGLASTVIPLREDIFDQAMVLLLYGQDAIEHRKICLCYRNDPRVGLSRYIDPLGVYSSFCSHHASG